jgi:hypothetical protein
MVLSHVVRPSEAADDSFVERMTFEAGAAFACQNRAESISAARSSRARAVLRQPGCPPRGGQKNRR